MKTDYDKMYAEDSRSHIDWIKKVGIWKAKQLCELIDTEPAESILEVGTGRGDVLNACYPFKERIGADISAEALEQQRREYGNENLVRLDADSPLPFGNKQVDFVLLCDILEHVDNPVRLLRESARVGKNLLLKIPIENAFLLRLMHKLRGVRYDQTHPSGHLYCWKLHDVIELVNKAGLEITKSKFIATELETTEKKYFFKTVVLSIIKMLDFFTPNHLFSRSLVGGSFFAIAREKQL
jgi:ubiquinone/menaquinone biosynthesis C-methylase UbiE